MTEPAILVLEDGYHQTGSRYGAAGTTTGEIVFATGMTGYQETFTDPSYHRQIVVMTAPHIGNTGMNPEDAESGRLWVAGLVVRDPARRASNWRSTEELEDQLVREGVVGIAGVDTRAITRHLRDAGVMRAGIFSGDALPSGTLSAPGLAALVDRVREAPPMTGSHLTDEVSTNTPYVVGPDAAEHVVVAVDLGIKSRTPEQLAERGCQVHVVPHTTRIAEILALRPDGVFFSNGPGDPAGAEREVELLRQVLAAGLPFFGICFGNQLLGRALGFGTYKLPFGHRGVNQPVRELPEGSVQITTHNHGFAVDVPVGEVVTSPYHDGRFGRLEVSHVSLNDGVVEGLRCLDVPAFSVQYHPEAAAGPHDGEHLFDRFVQLMRTRGPQAGKDGN